MPDEDDDKNKVISLVERSAREPDGFSELISGWNALFREADSLPEDRLGLDEIERAAQRVLDEGDTPPEGARFSSEVPRMLNSFAHATFLVSQNGRVNAVNRAGIEQFGPVDGKNIRTIGIALEGAEPLDEAVAKVLSPGRNSSELVLKRAFEDESERSMSVAIVPAGVVSGGVHLALVFLIDPQLNAAAGLMIEREFALTSAESEILSAFLSGQTPAEIAEQRGRSPATLRTQFQAILTKVGARNQAELVRSVMGVSQFVSEAEGVSHALRHPDRRSASVIRPGGRSVEVTLAGDPAGKPVIFVPSFTLYTFPNDVEAKFRAEGVCMISVCRPGFGGTDPAGPDETDEECMAKDIAAVMQQLEIGQCPFLTHSSATPYGVALAGLLPERMTRLVLLSGFVPRGYMHAAETSSPWAAALFRTSARSRTFRKLLVVSGMKMLRIVGAKRFVQMQLGGNMHDMVLASSPEFLSQFENAIRATLAQGIDPVLSEVAFGIRDWVDLIEKCKRPVVYLQGRHDPFMKLDTLRRVAADFPEWVSVEEIEDGGALLPLTHTQAVLDHLFNTASAPS